jgi:hypothetical protein
MACATFPSQLQLLLSPDPRPLVTPWLGFGKALIQAATWNVRKDVATLGLEGDKSRCARKFRDGVVFCLTSVQLRRYRKSVESRDPERCNSGLV